MGEWVHKKLGDLGEIITGSTPSTSKLEYWKGDYNFYSPADFTENVYCYKTERTVTLEGMNVGRCIPINSIMVACIASIGKIAINKTEGITNQQINTIVPLKDYNYLFLYYMLLHNSSIIKNGAAQTTIPIINKEDFSNLEFAIPISLSEQRRIASILSSADKVIDSTQKLIAKYKSIKQGMMEDLLKPKEGWKKVKLGEVGKISMCKRVFSFETSIEGEIPFYKIGTFGKTADAFITRQLFEEYKNKFSYPKVGDILISASGTIGRTVVYDGEPAYFQDSNIIWIDNDETIVLNQFLYYQYKIISWNLEGSTIARLYNDNFNKIEIFVPDFSEQRRIASILSSIDKKIESEEKVLEKYKNIKKGLMDKLLNNE